MLSNFVPPINDFYFYFQQLRFLLVGSEIRQLDALPLLCLENISNRVVEVAAKSQKQLGSLPSWIRISGVQSDISRPILSICSDIIALGQGQNPEFDEWNEIM